MRGKLLCAGAGLLAAGLLLAGCFNPLGGQGETGSGEQGTVVLVFQDMRAKTLVPEISLQITRFQVSFTRTGFQPVVLDDIPGDTVETDAVSLLSGPWELTVMAFNEVGNLIGIGSDGLQVRARQSARITVPIRSLSGPGTLSLSADLSELQLLDPSIGGTLTSGATQEMIPIQLGIEDSLGQYQGSLEAGTYLLNLQLSEGQTVIASYVDTVLIVQGLSTTGLLAFRPGSGSVIVQLLDEITRPIPITLLGLVESLDSEQSMTVTASTVQPMDSYRWYLDGEELAGEESAQLTLGPGLEEGPYLLTVVVRKGSTYSSQQGEFSVRAPGADVPVTGVSVEPESVSLEVGESQSLTATVFPNNATNRNVSWSSDDETVATVGAGNMLFAVGVGQTVITATTEDGGFTDTCEVEVTAAGNTWTITTIDDGLDSGSTQVGYFTSVGLDGSNHVHISYEDHSKQDLKYATNRTGTWQYEVLDEEGSVGRNTSLAVGLDGESIHISYHYQTGEQDQGLKYARKPSTSEPWATEWVDQTPSMASWGNFPAIGIVPDVSEPIDSKGEIHILYQNNTVTGATLTHAGGSYGNWVSFPAPPQFVGGAVRPPAMDVRFVSGGYELHAVYPLTIESATIGLYYSCYSSSTASWSAQELVASTQGHPSGASVVIRQYDIAVDAEGNVHVCCFDPQSGLRSLFYQFRDATTGDWLVEPEDRVWIDDVESAWVGYYSSIALDSQGNPHMSYQDQRPAGGLKHATSDVGMLKSAVQAWKDDQSPEKPLHPDFQWLVELVAGGGAYTSIAIGPSDDIHISYMSGGDLMYATTSE